MKFSVGWPLGSGEGALENGPPGDIMGGAHLSFLERCGVKRPVGMRPGRPGGILGPWQNVRIVAKSSNPSARPTGFAMRAMWRGGGNLGGKPAPVAVRSLLPSGRSAT